MIGFKRFGLRTGMACSMASLLIGVSSLSAFASDTPSYNNGDCWQSGTPTTCTWNHIGVKGAVYFRAIDNYSQYGYVNYDVPVHSAVSGWNSAPGPQYYSFAAHTNDVWQYINVSTSGNHDLNDQLTGITWVCDYITRGCVDHVPSNPAEIWYTNIYLNNSVLPPYGPNGIQSAAGHESGHGMGLYHNTTDSSSIMSTVIPGNLVPDSSDWGQSPGCSNGGHGTRCIYGG
jgi:hypothetical protein